MVISPQPAPITSARCAKRRRLVADLRDRLAFPCGAGKLPEHGALVEGVRVLGQARGAHEMVAERALVDASSPGASVPDSLHASEQQRSDLPLSEGKLGGSCLDLLPPCVGLEAVMLAIARGDRCALGGRFGAQPDAAALCLPSHLVPALGEVLHHLVRDARELCRALPDLAPCKPEPLGDERAQMRLVEGAGGLRGVVEERRVKRGEAAIRPAREIRRDDVGVELGVERPAHPVAVSGRDQPLRSLGALASGPAAHPDRRVLEIGEAGRDGLFVAGDELARGFLRSDREEHADRLRRREGEVEGGDLRVLRGGAKARPWPARIEPGDQRAELLAGHPAGEPAGAGARPDAGCLAATRVVVVAPACDLLLVVAVLAERDLADREHPNTKLAKTALCSATVCGWVERSEALTREGVDGRSGRRVRAGWVAGREAEVAKQGCVTRTKRESVR